MVFQGFSYETPAEIRMMGYFRRQMTSVCRLLHEVFLSAYLEIEKTASVPHALPTAAGISNAKLSHAEVTETASLVKDKFERLVKAIIRDSSF